MKQRKVIEYSTNFFVRDKHPTKLYLYVFDYKFNFYGKWAKTINSFLRKAE